MEETNDPNLELEFIINSVIDERMAHPMAYFQPANSLAGANYVQDLYWDLQRQIYSLQRELHRLKQPFWLRAWNYWRYR